MVADIQMHWKIKVMYQKEERGDMLIHWRDCDSKPSDKEMKELAKSWKNREGIYKLICVQRHQWKVENFWNS